MAESDHQLKYRKEVNERQKNWQDSINRERREKARLSS
jgi:hypothetical protein